MFVTLLTYFFKQMHKQISRIKNWFTKLLASLIIFLEYIQYTYFKSSPQIDLPYEDLTPKIIENEKDYSNALKWAIDNKSIKNLALTGTYGSGKSSILLSFQKKYKEYKYLNISLATFNKDELNAAAVNTPMNNLHLLEQSILQQMFYHVKGKDVPDSRFKRIRHLTPQHRYWMAISMFGWAICLLIVLLPRTLCVFPWTDYLYANWFQPLRIISLVLVIYGILHFLSSLIRIMQNSQFNKFNIASGEIEISPKLDSSILNKHLDEILYFFEAAKFDVVIIEDLDRFGEVEIFTKLRELNSLINNSKQISRHIPFIYAVKDELFGIENRTKFFDFIIPVIPVINSSNSYEILSTKLTNEKIEIDKDFLSEITLFINDMRMLNNIFNEFILYYKKLSGIKLNAEKLLSIIVYKNLYPSDFSALHNKKGMIYDALHKQKPKLIEEVLIDIKDKIIEHEVHNLEKIIPETERDTIALYVGYLIEKLPTGAVGIIINGTQHNWRQLIDYEVLKLLIPIDNLEYFFVDCGQNINAHSNIAFSSVVDNQGNSYSKRQQFFKSEQKKQIDELKSEIEQKKAFRRKTQSYTLSELLRSSELSIQLEGDITTHNLLTYLLRNGFIDEMYYSYISFFYEGSMTKPDMDFVFSIKNKSALEFTFELSKFPEILKRIRPIEFNEVEVLNYSLLDFLLENSNYEEQLKAFLTSLSNESYHSVNFIEGYIENGKSITLFIKELCKVWFGIWDYIYSHFSDYKKDQYLKLIINNVDLEDIHQLDKKAQFSSYMAYKPDFLILEEVNPNKVIEIIEKLEIDFIALSRVDESGKIFNFIYENMWYKINQHMINFLLGEKGDPNQIVNINTQHYSTIKNSKLDELIAYVDHNINDYISDVFLQIDGNVEEPEEVILELLANEKIEIKNKELIIESQMAKISDLHDIHPDLWTALARNSKFDPTWTNVLFYWSKNGMDVSIISFLNKEENYLTMALTRIIYADLTQDEINRLKAFVSEGNISLISFKTLLHCIPIKFGTLNFENIDNEKVSLLIQNNKIAFSIENYKAIKSNHRTSLIHFVEKFIDKIIESISDYELDTSDYVSILKSPIITSINKLTIIPLIDPEFLSDQNLANIIIGILSKNPKITLNFNVIRKLFEKGKDQKLKVEIFNLYYYTLSTNSITELLQSMGEPFSKLTEKGKRPKLNHSTENEKLVSSLYKSDYISSYKIKDGELKVNTKRT